MKVAIECHSPLLQKSLELFLSKYLSSKKHAEIVIRDEECFGDERCFYISSDTKADLVKPFSKSQLILALEHRYDELYPEKIIEKMGELEDEKNPLDFGILENRIEQLTQEYKENILRAVKTFYEK